MALDGAPSPAAPLSLLLRLFRLRLVPFPTGDGDPPRAAAARAQAAAEGAAAPRDSRRRTRTRASFGEHSGNGRPSSPGASVPFLRLPCVRRAAWWATAARRRRGHTLLEGRADQRGPRGEGCEAATERTSGVAGARSAGR